MFDKLEEGLSTKIPADNKGYQLLMKMGFKQGETLGKKPSTALQVPLMPELKKNKHGIDYKSEKR